MFKKILSSQLRINMVSGTATTAANAVVMLIAYPVYLHFLGYEKYGVWLVLATVLTFAQLGDLGIGPAIVKFVAEEYGRGNISGIQRYVATALAMLCISGSVVLLVILVFKTRIIMLFKLSDENAGMILWLLPYIGVLCIYVFIVQALNAVLSGLGRMDLANYIQSAGRVVVVLVASVLLYTGRGIESMLIASAVSYLLIHIATLVCVWRIASIRLLRMDNLDVQCGRHLLRFGSAMLGSSLIAILFDPFNKLMLSRYAGVSAIPVYDIALRGSMQIRSLIEVGLKALMPEISRIGANMTTYAQNRISQINRGAMMLIFVFGVPMYAGLIIFLTPLLKFWLKHEFVDELPVAFVIMLISSFISLLSVPAYYTLLGLGMVRHTLMSQVILSVVSALIISVIVLVCRRISVETISWAVLFATAATTSYLIWMNRRSVLKVRL
jgi:O-antigen/teichoic acid export membrane protein